MPELVYAFKPAAEVAIAEKRADLLRVRKLGIVTSDYVRRELRAFIEKQMWEAQQLAGEDALIGTRCPACDREHIMPGDVKSYRCRCSPHTERATFKHRFALI